MNGLSTAVRFADKSIFICFVAQKRKREREREKAKPTLKLSLLMAIIGALSARALTTSPSVSI